jgi:trehalose 6-phosphate phosphatase
VASALNVEALQPLRADPAHAAILLDIDGTLAPIVEHAADATVPEPTRQLVKALANRYGLVACVSGRRASEARAMVSVGTISYLGAHGAEVLRTGWTEPMLDPDVEDWVRRMHEFGREVESSDLRRNRVRMEDKGVILAFHWRGAPDEDAARAAVDAVAARAEAVGLRTHWGRKVLEVRPPVTIDKGSGISSLLDGSDIDSALFVGDDRTDLDAFRALAKLAEEGRLKHAVRVAVHSDEGPSELGSEADFIVEGISGVRNLLELLVAPAGEDPLGP